MKMIINISAVLCTFVLLLTLSSAEIAFAKRLAFKTENVKIAKLISHVNSLTSDRELTEVEKNLLFLLKTTQEIAEEKDLEIRIYANSKNYSQSSQSISSLFQQVTKSNLIQVINNRIKFYMSASNKVRKEHIPYIIKYKTKLYRLFSDSPYSRAYFLRAEKKPGIAKKVLKDLFQEQFRRVMELKEIHYGLSNDSPLKDAQYTAKLLSFISNKKEIRQTEDKVRKMKVHMSKVPQFHIQT